MTLNMNADVSTIFFRNHAFLRITHVEDFTEFLILSDAPSPSMWSDWNKQICNGIIFCNINPFVAILPFNIPGNTRKPKIF